MKIEAGIQQIYSGHADAIYSLARGKDGTVYSASGDGFVGVWDSATGAFREPLAKTPAPIYSIAPHPDEHRLYAGLRNGVFYSLDTESRNVVKSLKLSEEGLFDMKTLSGGRLLAAASGDGFIYLLDTETHELIQSLNLTDKAIRTLHVSPCSRFVIAGASDRKIYFLEIEDQLNLKQVIEAHDNSVFTAVYAEGYVLLSGGRDALLRRWRWQHEAAQWEAGEVVPAHNYTINKIAVHEDGHIFATCSRDKTVKIWDSESLKLLKVINLEKFEAGHTHSVNTLLWLDGTTLLSAGDDRRIIGWDIRVA